MSLSIDDVRRVARLAQLEFSDAEQSSLTRQLGEILEFVQQLQTIETNGVEPLAHPLDLHSVFRGDEPAASLSVSQALSNAPDSRDGFFVVPSVFEPKSP